MRSDEELYFEIVRGKTCLNCKFLDMYTRYNKYVGNCELHGVEVYSDSTCPRFKGTDAWRNEND